MKALDCLPAAKEVGRFELSLPGEHNLLNASAAVAAAVNAGVSAERAVDALSRFEGVKRRMEVKGEVAGTKVIDDFAHHPTAIEETIKAVRSKYQTGRLLAVLGAALQYYEARHDESSAPGKFGSSR